VTARGWGYRYPGRPEPVLAGATFTLEPGELVVLMGPSGSGKSTLLAALAGTLPPGGSVGHLGVGAGSADAVAPVARVGLVQQEPEANIVMELVGDDVAFPLENAAAPPGRIWPEVRAALGAVGLGVPLDRATSTLSGGQQQLLALAAATVGEPSLLLLDEPTANLDPESAGRVVAAVARVRDRLGCTVVVIEHMVEPWLARADLVLVASAASLVSVAPAGLGAHLVQHPELAGRVWVDHRHLPEHPPAREPGSPAVRATGLAVPGRLAPTDLTVRAGEVVAVTGPPGSGKSTLLACVSGLLAPSHGGVLVRAGGRDLADPWAWPAARVAATFGVVLQDPEHQFLTSRVRDELTHGLTGAGVPGPEASARADAMLARLHLAPLSDVDPFTLSGGQQRRLSVGTALVLDPGILVLDEPTFGQDPQTWAEMVGIIAAHRDAGGAVLLATHDPDLVRVLRARQVRLTAPAPDRSPMVVDAASAGGGPGRARGLRRLDPLALVGAAALLSVAALMSASVALNLGLAALALLAALLGGLPRRRVVLLAAPATVATVSVAVSNALLSDAGITSGPAWQAAALPASRVLAVALPGLVAAVAVDPTGLADSLVGRLRVPARPAYSVLAGLRLLPLLADEWTTLGLASRARGVGGSGPVERARQFGSRTFRLLVAALRRGGRLAISLDVRGLRAGAPRTVARPLRWSAADTGALAVGAAAVVAALAPRL
jgi:energy-coupling factor transport system ATP-binding protein